MTDARVFFTNKGAENFEKILVKKEFIEERGFKELVPPFKEKVEGRGWEMLCEHLKLGRRSLVQEFYANFRERKNLTCYVRGKWVPFGERAISQLSGLREVGDCTEYKNLQRNPNFEEIVKELKRGQGKW